MKTTHTPNTKKELHTLEDGWRRLHGWQKFAIITPLHFWRIVTAIADWLPQTLDTHIVRRRASFAYFYPAHWLRR